MSYPLSPAQEDIWLVSQLGNAANSAYKINLRYEFSERVDLERLEQAVKAVVYKHPVLSIEINPVVVDRELPEDGQLVGNNQNCFFQQVPVKFSEPLINVFEVTSSVDQVEALDLKHNSIVEKKINDTFVASLVRLPKKDLLCLTFHHVIFDGWSAKVFCEELSHFYEAAVFPLKPIERCNLFFRYAEEQHRLWRNNINDHRLQKWSKTINGTSPYINLALQKNLRSGYDKPASGKNYIGESICFPMHNNLNNAVIELTREICITPFSWYLSVFMLLLSKCSGSTDFPITLPISSRHPIYHEAAMGCFINTVILRANIADKCSLIALAKSVNKQVLFCLDNRDIPFSNVAHELRRSGGYSANDLYSFSFTMVSEYPDKLTLGALNGKAHPTDITYAKNKLSVEVLQGQRGVSVRFIYDSVHFDESTIEIMTDQYISLIELGSREPERDINSIVSEVRGSVLHLGFMENIVKSQRIQEVVDPVTEIENNFSELSGRTAICFEDNNVSYSALGEQVYTLCDQLNQLQMSNENPIGIYLSRSAGMIASILAVLSSGKYFLPIDSTAPIERVRKLLKRSNCKILITETKNHLDFKNIVSRCIDPDNLSLVYRGKHSTKYATISKKMPAYLIYTSGSSGEPKGVVVTRGNLFHFLSSIRSVFDLAPTDKFLAVTPISFDIALLELLLPLLSGAVVDLVSDTERGDVDILIKKLEKSSPDYIQTTPSIWQEIVQAGWHPTKGVKLLAGGEAFPPALSDEIFSSCSEAELFNLYGPTEATIWTSVKKIQQGKEVTIGEPFAYCEYYVLDGGGNQLPVGMVGELFIGGEQVAEGYFGDPRLTAEKFLPDPFSTKTTRVYRTGDAAVRLANGEIKILDRLDNQIKLRGHRIEPAEIEKIIKDDRLVGDAVIKKHRNHLGVDILVAHLCTPSIKPADASRIHPILEKRIKLVLREQLPRIMHPSKFVFWPRFCLNSNGKVDRKALFYTPTTDKSNEKIELPHSDTEKRVADVWCSTLNLENIGRESNFFELGGLSIHIPKLILNVQRAFSVTISLDEIYDCSDFMAFVSLLTDKISEQEILCL